jgi:dTDP-4-dehydrorhamnose reductase
MKTILLGPNGQLGSDLLRENGRRGEPLAIVPVTRAELELSEIDKAIENLGRRDFDCLINCSSYHRTDEVERNAQLAFTINAHLVECLADLCRRRKAQLVHISTDYVFGGNPNSDPLAESAPKSPINVYGASKAMGEDLALMTGADVVIVRVASLFGVAGASGKGGNFVETMIRIGKEKGALRVIADQTMSPTSTADAAAAILDMLARGVRTGIWHVVNSGTATWHQFAAEIITRTGVEATVTPIGAAEFPTTARRPKYSALDNSKLQSEITPMRPWQEALDAYLAAKGYR